MCDEVKSPIPLERNSKKTVGGKTMSLTAYRSNRVFAKTRKPVGRVRRGNRSRIFVVQKHDASRLLYDFRLAVNGVLASWAVPKGPSMNPADKRLAVRPEDHPLQYAKFVIPPGKIRSRNGGTWESTNHWKISR